MRARGATLLTLTALCVATAVLPASLRPLVVLAAFGAGVAFARPATLRQWAQSPRTLVAAPYVAGAVIAVAATVAILGVGPLGPSSLSDSLVGLVEPFLPDGRAESGTRRATTGARPVKRQARPKVRVLKRALDRPFTVEGVSFRVTLIGGGSAAARIGTRIISLGVSGRNVQRERFNSNRLIYRLKDRQGRQYSSLTSGGTGPPSLAKTGFFDRGQTARTRVVFQVPKSARGLVLVFEPSFDATFQVQVPVTEG